MTLPNLCIVLEYAARGGLDTLLKNQKPKGAPSANAVKLTAALRLRIALSIVRGLAYLHSSEPPFIHRDLKPANCFVFEDPAVVKIGCVGGGGLRARRRGGATRRYASQCPPPTIPTPTHPLLCPFPERRAATLG